jgi:hypothetical protein
MRENIINGTYGSSHTPCSILVYEDKMKGGSWYCVEGSKNVNFTYQELKSSVDVELIEDIYYFTNDSEIETIDELIAAVSV